MPTLPEIQIGEVKRVIEELKQDVKDHEKDAKWNSENGEFITAHNWNIRKETTQRIIDKIEKYIADDSIVIANVNSRLVEICDRKCNQCPLINKSNSRMITVILNKLFDKFGDGVYKIVEDHCPNLTVCYDCKIDDFCHIEGCKLVDWEDGC